MYSKRNSTHGVVTPDPFILAVARSRDQLIEHALLRSVVRDNSPLVLLANLYTTKSMSKTNEDNSLNQVPLNVTLNLVNY
jgi:hypothetical protein